MGKREDLNERERSAREDLRAVDILGTQFIRVGCNKKGSEAKK